MEEDILMSLPDGSAVKCKLNVQISVPIFHSRHGVSVL